MSNTNIGVSNVPPKYRKLYKKTVSGKVSPRDAIKMFCLECVGWVREEVKQCNQELSTLPV